MAGKLRSLVVTLRVGSSSVNQPTSAILGASFQYAIVDRNTVRTYRNTIVPAQHQQRAESESPQTDTSTGATVIRGPCYC